MALYDINGNVISSGGSASGITPNDTTFVQSEAINLLDNAEFMGNKRWADNRWYDFSDYSAWDIPIDGVGVYYFNIMNRYSTHSPSGNNGIALLDAGKNVLSLHTLPQTLTGYDSTGNGIYADTGEFEVTDENAKYIRLWYWTESLPENPNINTQGYDFLDSDGELCDYHLGAMTEDALKESIEELLNKNVKRNWCSLPTWLFKKVL